jgi:hypothetical protein
MFCILIVASSWEIRNLNSPMISNSRRCLVTHTLEINSASWNRWKNKRCSKFERSIPYTLLCQVSSKYLSHYFSSYISLKYLELLEVQVIKTMWPKLIACSVCLGEHLLKVILNELDFVKLSVK